jgi:hypothetical protein
MTENKEQGDIGEDFVNQLAYKSLLKYWCYPNVKDEDGDKKEICDLLVLFKNICIIITVKNYKFNGNHERYFKSTIEKGIKQLNGAERRLFNFPREIHIKHPEREKEKFEKEKYNTIYRIIVNLGEGLEFYNVRETNANGDFIFVFDKETLQILLTELDTISDLTEYFEKREELFKGRNSVIFQGQEKDLIALFIKHGKKFPPEFTQEGFNTVVFDIEDQWEEFITEQKEKIKAKKEEDKVSYFIDQLTEREINNLPNGHLLSQELLVLNRFGRRTLTKIFFDFYSIHHLRNVKATGHRYVELEDIGFVFFYYSDDIRDEEFTNTMLETAVIGHSINSNYKMKKMYGIATTNEMKQYKFMYLEVNEPFSKEIIENANEVIKELGWFTKITKNEFTEKEYPNE